MKKVTSTLTAVLLCLIVSAQVGSLETTTFNPPNGFVINNLSANRDDHGNSIAIQPADGKIVVAVVTTEDVFKIVRYLPDGTLDPTFGTGGIVSMNLTGTPTSVDACQSYAVGIQSTGKIVVGGYNWKFQDKDFVLARFNTDGSLDATFGSPSTPGIVMTQVSPLNFSSYGEDVIRSLVILSDNSIIAAGYAYMGRYNDFAVAKYTADGALDNTFGNGGYTITNVHNDNMANGVAVNSTGEIFVVGTSNINSLTGDYAFCRYSSGGALIQKITSGISGIDVGNGIAIQSDDHILVTGKRPALLSTTTTDMFLARYKPDGTLDAGFGTGGIATTNAGPGSSNDEGWGIAVQSTGKIIVSGTTDGNVSSSNDFLLARYNSTGTLDGTFGSSGLSRAAISNQKDIGSAVKVFGSRIYVAGSANYTGSTTTNFALAAFNDAVGGPLPLVLSQFYAQKQTSKVVLQWQTSSEEGVKQFVIERSNDGKTFKAIGTVAAIGNSSLTQKYSFADQSPLLSATNYYRLLMQDANGSYKYSKTLNIRFDGELSEMKVYPSFVKDVLQVQLPEGMQGNIAIQIFDMSGHMIRRINMAGDGHALNTTVDVSTLVRGVYVIKASAGNTTAISRFTKN